MTTVDTVDTIKKVDQTKADFLVALGDESIAGNVSVACKKIGKTRAYLYQLRKEDPDFASRWNAVRQDAFEAFADLAENKLFEGVKEGNTALIIFALKNLRPERWKERRELETPKDRPLEISMPGLVDLIKQRYPDAANLLRHGSDKPETTGG